jgi:HEPN domain-containing protein
MTSDQNDYLKNWLFHANEDVLVIENLFESGSEMFSSSICFHAQQAVEKFLKAFLVYHDIDFPKTHDLDFLLLECKKVNDKIFDIDLGSLTDFGVSVRYPDDFYIPDKEQTFFFRDISLKVKEIVVANIKL